MKVNVGMMYRNIDFFILNAHVTNPKTASWNLTPG